MKDSKMPLLWPTHKLSIVSMFACRQYAGRPRCRCRHQARYTQNPGKNLKKNIQQAEMAHITSSPSKTHSTDDKLLLSNAAKYDPMEQTAERQVPCAQKKASIYIIYIYIYIVVFHLNSSGDQS